MRENFFEFHDASIFENDDIMAQWNKMFKYKRLLGFSAVFVILTSRPDY